MKLRWLFGLECSVIEYLHRVSSLVESNYILAKNLDPHKQGKVLCLLNKNVPREGIISLLFRSSSSTAFFNVKTIKSRRSPWLDKKKEGNV